MTGQDCPLAVDLDGTLVRSDTLVESVVVLVRRNLFIVLPLLWWLVRGKLFFKQQMARRTGISAKDLPYREELITYLRTQHQLGRAIYLVTAAPMIVARRVADHLGLFADVMASETENLAGEVKAGALVDRFGRGGYDYVGNSWRDLPVWRQARRALVVSNNSRLVQAVRRVTLVERVFASSRSWRTWALLLRSHQWVKNVLVFVPMVAAHALTTHNFMATSVALVAWCLTASGLYIVNDLVDLTADRHHPTKRQRPLAAGEVSLVHGAVIALCLLMSGLGLGLSLNRGFGVWLLVYLFVALAYSWYLKQLVLIDVVILGLLYTIRIFAGAAVVGVVVSTWLFVFSLFFFMGLALVKRYCELRRLSPSTGEALRGRGYRVTDQTPLGSMGIASGLLAALVLALYISSPEIAVLYHTPVVLWGLVPLLLYWIGRVWVVAYRGQMHDDPVVFAMRDWTSWVVLVMGLLIVFLAT